MTRFTLDVGSSSRNAVSSRTVPWEGRRAGHVTPPQRHHTSCSSHLLSPLAQGAWTLTVGRTVGRTLSAQGWSATLTAMPPELTGIKSNWWRPAWLDPPNTTYPDTHLEPVMGNTEPFPTVFSVRVTLGNTWETQMKCFGWSVGKGLPPGCDGVVRKERDETQRVNIFHVFQD